MREGVREVGREGRKGRRECWERRGELRRRERREERAHWELVRRGREMEGAEKRGGPLVRLIVRLG